MTTPAPAPMTRVITEVALEELDLRCASLRLIAPTAVARLKAAVARDGVRQSVLAATAVEPGRRVLGDGFKRVRVARELAIARLHAILLALDAPTALATMLQANAGQPGLTALAEGWNVRRLCREYGLTQQRAGGRRAGGAAPVVGLPAGPARRAAR
jgi:ParB-like chromosome segregation protein Spo0J